MTLDQDMTATPGPDAEEDDTEGQAFKWEVVEDPKGGRQLRQGWSPDEPGTGRPRTATTPPKGKATTR
jgi:hypothetical protein